MLYRALLAALVVAALLLQPPTGVAQDSQPGAVLLADDFQSPSKGVFPPGSTNPGRWAGGYDGGEYIIRTLHPSASVAGIRALPSFTDIAVSVDVRVEGETSGRTVSLYCRTQPTNNGGYGLAVTPAAGGQFLLSRIDTDGQRVPLAGWRQSPVINRENDWNHLELTCAGDTLTAAINGVELARAQDGTYAQGRIAIGASANSETVEARFDNLLVVSANEGRAAPPPPTTIPSPTPPPPTTVPSPTPQPTTTQRPAPTPVPTATTVPAIPTPLVLADAATSGRPASIAAPELRGAIDAIWTWSEGRQLLRDAASLGIEYLAEEMPDGVGTRLYGVFDPAGRRIHINTQGIEGANDWVIAVVLVHELRHASDFARGVRQSDTAVDCYASEVRAFLTEVRWYRFAETNLPRGRMEGRRARGIVADVWALNAWLRVYEDIPEVASNPTLLDYWQLILEDRLLSPYGKTCSTLP